MFSPIQKHYAAGLSLDFASMVFQTVLPFYVFQRLGGGELMSGGIHAAMSLTYGVMCVIGARLARDVRNGLPVAAAGALGYGLFIAICGAFASPVPFTLALMASTGCLAVVWPILYAWLASEPDLARRGRILSYFNIAWALGLSAGSLAAGPLFERHYYLPVVAAIVTAALAAALIFTQPSEKDYFGTQVGPLAGEAGPAGPAPPRYLAPSWIAMISGFAIQGASRSVYPKHFDDLVASNAVFVLPGGLFRLTGFESASLFSVLGFALTSASTLTFFIMGRTVRWHRGFSHIIAVQVLTAAALYMLSATHSLAIMFVCFALMGANAYVTLFTAVFHSVADPERKRMNAAFTESLVGLGAFAGSLSFALIATYTSVASVFAYAPAVILACVAAELVLVRRARAAQPLGR